MQYSEDVDGIVRGPVENEPVLEIVHGPTTQVL